MHRCCVSKFTVYLMCLLSACMLHCTGLAQTAADTNQIKANIQICTDSVAVNPTFAYRLSSENLALSKKVNYPWGVFMNTMIIGLIKRTDGKVKEAAALHEEALRYCRTYHFKHKESVVLANLGKDYAAAGDHKKGLEFCQQAAEVAKAIKDTVQWAQALESMGETYNLMGLYQQTIQYCGQAVTMFVQKNRYQSARLAYNNISTAYMDAGKYDSAYKYIWASYEQYKKAGPGAQPPSEFYQNLGICYDSLGKKDSATYCYLKTLEICKATGNDLALQAAYYHLAIVYQQKRNWAKAIYYFKLSLALTEKYNNFEGTVKNTSSLAEIYAEKGDFANAYAYRLKSSSANDSLINQEKIKTIEELNAKFETQQIKNEYERKALLNKVAQDKKLTEITLANEQKVARRNMLLYTFISIAAILLASIYFVVKYFRQRAIITHNKNNELKQQLLLTQMNPHFIFNSVDNIQSLIYNHQDEAAVNYLTKFSKLTRQILENSRENFITLSEEISMLENYLTIQQLLYNNRFQHTIQVGENIDPEAILLPPMLTQPFIENAIKHGLKDKTEGGLVVIRFDLSGDQLLFEVTDNGSGLIEKVTNNGQQSLSTQITEERLQRLSPKKKIAISTVNRVDSNQQITGVKTSFEIPYQWNQ